MDGLFSVGWAFQLIMLFSLCIAEIISILLTVAQKAAQHAPSSPGKINVFFFVICHVKICIYYWKEKVNDKQSQN